MNHSEFYLWNAACLNASIRRPLGTARSTMQTYAAMQREKNMFGLFAKNTAGVSKQVQTKTRLEVENLEERMVPAAVVTPYPIVSVSAGNIHIQGTDLNDKVTISHSTLGYVVTLEKASAEFTRNVYVQCGSVYNGHVYFDGYG